jgi:transcriptional/translational regulatory protein YebC/TACO1
VRAGDLFEIHGEPGAFLDLKAALERAGLKLEDASVGYTPTTRAEVADVDVARRVLNLIEALDEHDDVQNTWANYDLPDAMAAQLAAES